MNAPAATTGVVLVVVAKEPVAGQVKTRLCPPCTLEQASLVAAAALADTLDAVAATPARRHVLAMVGNPPACMPAGFEVVAQRGDGLAQRLAATFADVGGPAIALAMDTPHVTPRLLADSCAALLAPGVDAVLGRDVDGGYLAIGLRRNAPGLFDGVPMSTPGTGAAQLRTLQQLGLTVGLLPTLVDMDDIDSARAIARMVPTSRMARVLGDIDPAVGTSA